MHNTKVGAFSLHLTFRVKWRETSFDYEEGPVQCPQPEDYGSFRWDKDRGIAWHNEACIKHSIAPVDNVLVVA